MGPTEYFCFSQVGPSCARFYCVARLRFFLAGGAGAAATTSEKYTSLVFRNGQNTIAESYSKFRCDEPPQFMLKFKKNGL